MFDDAFLNELKYRVDIEDVISQYVHLKNNGRTLVGLCPFHIEKTPSFHVYRETGSFYCFGCGKGGDIITFVMLMENVDYPEAIKILANKASLRLPDDNHYDFKKASLRTSIFEMNRVAARFFHENLYKKSSEKALKYLENRGVSNKIIRRFGLGFATDARDTLTKFLISKGYNKQDIIRANLAFINKYGTLSDRFFNRIIFPIIDLKGNIIAFGGRILNEAKPKYLNTSDTIVFKKSNNLFALNFARKHKVDKFILVEGYMDVIALHQIGFYEAVATLGTAITKEQAKLMARFVDKVIISYDADSAGKAATERAISLLKGQGLEVKILSLSHGKDPDEYIKMLGSTAVTKFKNLINSSKNDIDYQLDNLKKIYNIDDSFGKIKYLKESIKILSSINSVLERNVFISKVASEMNVDQRFIIKQVQKNLKLKKEYSDKVQVSSLIANLNRKRKNNVTEATNLKANIAEKAMLSFILKNFNKKNSGILKELSPEYFGDALHAKLFSYLKDAHEKDDAFEFFDLSKKFSPKEMSYISEMVAMSYDTLNDASDIKRYADVIKYEYKKKKLKKEISLNADGIEDYMNILKRHKN